MSNDKDNDDIDSFREAMSGVKPLQQDKASPWKARHKPVPLPKSDDDDAEELRDLNVETPEFLEFQRPGVQNRLYADLRRGLLPPEASVDLHGMRVVEARKTLARFLAQCLGKGTRVIRIVHGKGRGSADRQPVLKQKVNQWLQQKPEVLAFTSAPRWDGGTGAVYVLLSRKHHSGD